MVQSAGHPGMPHPGMGMGDMRMQGMEGQGLMPQGPGFEMQGMPSPGQQGPFHAQHQGPSRGPPQGPFPDGQPNGSPLPRGGQSSQYDVGLLIAWHSVVILLQLMVASAAAHQLMTFRDVPLPPCTTYVCFWAI